MVGRDACALLDSLAAGSFLGSAYEIYGKAKLDVRQNRLKGRMRISSTPLGGTPAAGGGPARLITIDFTGSSYFGSQREDMTIVLREKELTVLDRERGNYLEGEEGRRYVEENIGLEGDVVEALRIALGGVPSCSELEDLEARSGGKGIVFDGAKSGNLVRLHFFPGGRIRRIIWPLVEPRKGEERVEIEYAWGRSDTIKRISILLERRNWRIRFDVEGSLASTGPSSGGN